MCLGWWSAQTNKHWWRWWDCIYDGALLCCSFSVYPPTRSLNHQNIFVAWIFHWHQPFWNDEFAWRRLENKISILSVARRHRGRVESPQRQRVISQPSTSSSRRCIWGRFRVGKKIMWIEIEAWKKRRWEMLLPTVLFSTNFYALFSSLFLSPHEIFMSREWDESS